MRCCVLHLFTPLSLLWGSRLWVVTHRKVCLTTLAVGAHTLRKPSSTIKASQSCLSHTTSFLLVDLTILRGAYLPLKPPVPHLSQDPTTEPNHYQQHSPPCQAQHTTTSTSTIATHDVPPDPSSSTVTGLKATMTSADAQTASTTISSAD